MVLLVKFHLNQQQSLILSVLMASKNKKVWSTSVLPPQSQDRHSHMHILAARQG